MAVRRLATFLLVSACGRRSLAACRQGEVGHPLCKACTWQDIANVTLKPACRGENDTVDATFCKEFALAAVLPMADCSEGTPFDTSSIPQVAMDSPCWRANRLRGITNRLFTVNLLALSMLVLNVLPAVVLLLIPPKPTQKKRDIAACAMGFFFTVALVMQAWSLNLSFEGIDGDARRLLRAGCLSAEGADQLGLVVEEIEMLQYLSLLEVILCACGFILTCVAWCNAEVNSNRKQLLILQSILLMICLLTILLGEREFRLCTLHPKSVVDSLFQSLAGTIVEGMQTCVETATLLGGYSQCRVRETNDGFSWGMPNTVTLLLVGVSIAFPLLLFMAECLLGKAYKRVCRAVVNEEAPAVGGQGGQAEQLPEVLVSV